jgi:hypothetical protein
LWIELTTGKDSFRALNASPRRNVSVATFVRVNDDGAGRKVVPLFAAYQRKLAEFRETSLVSTIPATSNFDPNIAGQWFVNRHEVMPGTEILIEHRRRETTGFGERIEYLMIKADDHASLWRTTIELPRHELSAVSCVHMTGRYQIIDKDEQLSDEAADVWRDYLSIPEDYHVSDYLDPNQDEQFYYHTEMEKAERRTERVEVSTVGGRRRVKIRRSRKIKTR